MELRKLKASDLMPDTVIAQAKQRLRICGGCPTMGITPTFGMTCGKLGKEIPGVQCGCVLKIKAYLPMFDCPQRKWDNL